MTQPRVKTAVGLGSAFVVFASVLLVFDYGLTHFGVEENFRINLDLIDDVRSWRQQVRELRKDPTHSVVAVIGDSLTMGSLAMERAGHSALPGRLEQVLSQRPEFLDVRVAPLRWGGLGPVEVFNLADVIVGAEAPIVILTCNLASLTMAWAVRFDRTELAAWIEPRRVPAALLLPLHRVGLSADRVLWYVSLRESGLESLWREARRLQTRGERVRPRLAQWLGRVPRRDTEESAASRSLLGARKDTIPGKNRFTGSRLRRSYSAAMAGVKPGDPLMRFLRAAMQHLVSRGIRVLLVVMPVNLEHWRAVGAFDDPSGLQKTLDTLEQHALASGAGFVDLHDLLPDRAFRDRASHFTRQGPVDGTARVAKALAPTVVAELRRLAPN